jgi:hypothetical protein
LPSQFVSDHRRFRSDAGDDRHGWSAALNCCDQATKVAVAGEQHDVIDVLGNFQGINAKLDADVSLDLSAAGTVIKFLCGFRGNGESVVIEPVRQRPHRLEFCFLDEGGDVVVCAHEHPAVSKLGEQPLKIDVKAKGSRGEVEIGASINSAILSDAPKLSSCAFSRIASSLTTLPHLPGMQFEHSCCPQSVALPQSGPANGGLRSAWRVSIGRLRARPTRRRLPSDSRALAESSPAEFYSFSSLA